MLSSIRSRSRRRKPPKRMQRSMEMAGAAALPAPKCASLWGQRLRKLTLVTYPKNTMERPLQNDPLCGFPLASLQSNPKMMTQSHLPRPELSIIIFLHAGRLQKPSHSRFCHVERGNLCTHGPLDALERWDRMGGPVQSSAAGKMSLSGISCLHSGRNPPPIDCRLDSNAMWLLHRKAIGQLTLSFAAARPARWGGRRSRGSGSSLSRSDHSFPAGFLCVFCDGTNEKYGIWSPPNGDI